MKICWIIFSILVGIFVFAVTPVGGLVHSQGDFRNLVNPLGIAGAALLIFTCITWMRRPLKAFLILTGASSVLWPVSLFLHSILTRFFPNEPVTFILFFYVSTVGFMIGALGTVIIGLKQLISSH